MNSGIYRIYGDRVDHYPAASDSTREILQFAEDHEGSIWFVSSEGLERFSDRRVVTVTDDEKFHSAAVHGVSVARNGTLWVTGTDTLLTLAPGSHTFSAPVTISNAAATSILEDHTGTVWVGVSAATTVPPSARLQSRHCAGTVTLHCLHQPLVSGSPA